MSEPEAEVLWRSDDGEFQVVRARLWGNEPTFMRHHGEGVYRWCQDETMAGQAIASLAATVKALREERAEIRRLLIEGLSSARKRSSNPDKDEELRFALSLICSDLVDRLASPSVPAVSAEEGP